MIDGIRLAGGPGHGTFAPANTTRFVLPVGKPDPHQFARYEYVEYERRTLAVDGRDVEALTPEGMDDIEAAYHIGRIVGADERQHRDQDDNPNSSSGE